jgi:membrane fusion protein (multidrug efflux system)
MTMGGHVEVGDLLVQLDARDLEIRLEEEEVRLASLERELAAAREELELRRRALGGNRETSRLTLEEARNRLREAEIEARFAAQEAERAGVLEADGQISRVEADRKRSEAERLRAAAESYRITVARQESEESTRELSDQTELAQLRGAAARLEGEAATAAVEIDKIRHEIGKRSLRAPQAGEVGEVIDLRVASLVREGDRLGTILAAGDIKVIADFAAASALGRVGLGQPARVRLDGFPWTQYGMLTATVDRVATEPRAGRLRVELEVDAGGATSVPMQHGLTGTVEVEVERISPVALLLRTLGKVLHPKPPEAATDRAAR